jgi:beta-N-acetylhexosaminidase
MTHITENQRAAASTVLIGFPGTSVSLDAKELLRMGAAGVILFRKNIESIEQVQELSKELQSIRKDMIISIDQEGGRVKRLLDPFFDPGPMLSLKEDPFEAGKRIGLDLAQLGINLNFAPVLDIHTNPDNPIIGDRAFGTSAQSVIDKAIPFGAGLLAGGVQCCGKHFPGHGDTQTDSHLELPSLELSIDALHKRELLPFAAAAKSFAAIMSAHIVFKDIDPDLPATLSKSVLQILRSELEFTGVIISDDLEMKAIADHFSPEQIAQLGCEAGIDLFLACHTPDIQHALIESIAAWGDSHPQQLLEKSIKISHLV